MFWNVFLLNFGLKAKFVILYNSKDVRLPVQLQRAMAAEAEASREARAKVIAAEGEQKASRALREASEIIGDSPAALQLRYLQVKHDSSILKFDFKNSLIQTDTQHHLLGKELNHRLSAANRLAHFFYEENRNSISNSLISTQR